MQDLLEVFELHAVHGSRPCPSTLLVVGSRERVPSGSMVILTLTTKVVDVILLICRRYLLQEAPMFSLDVHLSLVQAITNSKWSDKKSAVD
jgi:hypothetical protein